MVVSGTGITPGTTVLSSSDPAAAITGNAYIPTVSSNIGAKISDFTYRLNQNKTADISTGDIIEYIGAGNPGWVNYTPPSSVTQVFTAGGLNVTEFSLSPFQPSNTLIGALIRFSPTLTGTTTLTLTAYNNTIAPGMRVSGTYIPTGTVVVSNTDTLIDGIQRSVIILNKVMTQRPDVNGVYSFNTQEITLSQVATVVNGSTLSFRNVAPFTESNNVVTVNTVLPASVYIKIQLNDDALWNSHGAYEYTRLHDVIDNFLVAYVGIGKLITSIKRTDVIFHARSGLKEFSYDTLNQSPYYTFIQDNLGNPVQDSNASNTEGSSEMNAAWNATDPRRISGGYINNVTNANGVFDNSVYDGALGQRYGMEPQTSQKNGWFKIDERKGTFNFTSNLANQLILLEYISDGNAYDLDARIPKLAEEALYAYIIYNILATSSGIQEYIVKRFQKEKSAKLRNAKIRLSNLKIDQIAQVMRGKSKWIKF